MPKLVDLSGKTFGLLTVISRIGSKNRRALWNCHCSCGNHTQVITADLNSGNTKSCGCLVKSFLKKLKTTHGHAANHTVSETYATWEGMKARCSNPKNKFYKRYGGRGISVSERWEDFSAFLADMGERPKGLTLERIDNNNGYSKQNCMWATNTQQARNRSTSRLLTIDGESRCIAEWAEIYGISQSSISSRLAREWSDYDAVTKSIKKHA